MSLDVGLDALFFAARPGSGVPPLLGGTLLTWNATTFENTVDVGTSSPAANLPVIGASSLVVGPVLLASTPAGLIVLGNLSRYVSPTI